MPNLTTFHHPLRTATKTGQVHSIKLTTLPERTQIVRDLIDKASKPTKWQRPRFKEKRVFPIFEPGITTLAYIEQYHEINKSRSGGSAHGWKHVGVNLASVVYMTDLNRPAPMLDPALPEMWEDFDPEPEIPEWLK